MNVASKGFVKKIRNRKILKDWILRFIKFNIVGIVVFLIGTVIFSAAFSTFGAWTWLLANAAGSVLQFSLINYLNKTKKGRIFDNCQPKSNP